MDVQPPRSIPVTVTTTDTEKEPATPSTPLAPPTVETPVAAPAVEEPAPDQALSAAPEAAEVATPEAETTIPVSSDHPVTPNPLAIPELSPPHKKGAPLVAVIVAVVIAVVLAGITVFAYLKTKDAAPAAQQTSNSVSEQTAKPVTATEVDATNTQLEEDLKAVDEDKDFNSSDLSDQSLGL
ncbi:MAG: hypothetical protein JWL85_980 [Candidatus Saccharibacteria bacterium]|nr:hypothetical protein [Candidatus Saccharibacteria bacterium]